MNYVFGYIIIGLICAGIAMTKKENPMIWILFWPLTLFYTLLFKILGTGNQE